MKIAVYTCALNEEKFVQRWAESTQYADYRFVLDTGSSDATISKLRDCRIDVVNAVVQPWRFDDARNMALNMLPSDTDIAIALDIDEVLTPGWREKIESIWSRSPGVTRLRYLYVWNWLEEGHPDQIFYADKITGRFTHRWRGAAHEVLQATTSELTAICDSVLIEHHSDDDKDRGNYLNLLNTAAQEDPLNDRCAHYYARELYFHHQYKQAIIQFQRHLSLASAKWPPERASSLRYIAKSYELIGNDEIAYRNYVSATLEDTASREACIDLAKFLLKHQDWAGVIHFCNKAILIPTDALHYISERYAREEGPFDLASVAMYHLGLKQGALEFAKRALSYNPRDIRIQENVRFIEYGPQTN